jgi:hypothetical protein
MSLDEAHQILNVKKDDPMDIIQKVSVTLGPVPIAGLFAAMRLFIAAVHRGSVS